jgi:G3E family GTPase
VNGAAHLDQQEEAVRQVAVADRIVISKADLADPEPLRERLSRLNPGARVIEARNGVIDPLAVLNAGLFAAEGKMSDVRAWLDAEAFANQDPHPHHHDPNRHDTSISAFCLTFDEPLDWTVMGLWLQTLVSSHGQNLLRVKGILNLRGHDRPMAIHIVRHLIHPPEKLIGWAPADRRTSRIVFITRDIPEPTVEASLRAFQAAFVAPFTSTES